MAAYRFKSEAMPADVQEVVKQAQRRWPQILNWVLILVSLVESVLSLIITLYSR